MSASERSLGRIAVVGAGFIGTHIAAGVLASGAATTVITRSPLDSRKAKLLAGAEVVIADASARALIEPALSEIDHVVYCSAGLMPAESNLDPIADAGLSLPPLINVLEILRRRPGAGITYLSSGGTVYGEARSPLIAETHPTEPLTSYGIMKLAGERYVLMYRRLHGVPARILRCANVYGEHQPSTRSQGAIAVFLERIASGMPVPLFGDGSLVRDFVHVGDVVPMVLRATPDAGSAPVINVGSGEGTSLRGAIAMIERLTGREAVIETRPARSLDVPRVVLDIALARRHFGFDPLPLADGVAVTLERERVESQVRRTMSR